MLGYLRCGASWQCDERLRQWKKLQKKTFWMADDYYIIIDDRSTLTNSANILVTIILFSWLQSRSNINRFFSKIHFLNQLVLHLASLCALPCLPLSSCSCYGYSDVVPGCSPLSSPSRITAKPTPTLVKHTEPPLTCRHRVLTHPAAHAHITK